MSGMGTRLGCSHAVRGGERALNNGFSRCLARVIRTYGTATLGPATASATLHEPLDSLRPEAC